MKERTTTGQKLRFVAGGLYALLALYQMLCCYYVVQTLSSAEAYYAWQLSVGAMGLYAGMAVWMFAGRRALAPGARRAIAVGTLLLVCYQLITYRAQTGLISTALYSLLPALYENTLAHLLFLLGRLLLLILAACVAFASREDGMYAVNEAETDYPEADGMDEMLVREMVIEEAVALVRQKDEADVEEEAGNKA